MCKMGLVSKLQDELIVIQTQLDQVKAVTPENPQIPGLIAREKSLRKEISQQMKAISGGGEGSVVQSGGGISARVLETNWPRNNWLRR